MSTASLALTLNSTPQDRALYELPERGASITEWVARRLHKTELLTAAAAYLPQDAPTALAHFGLFAAAASASYGPARYQPRFDAPGRTVDATDPATGAATHVVFEGSSPHLRFSYRITLTGVGEVSGHEEITGTTVGLRGLGMPAPSVFRFAGADGAYQADAVGIITSELAPRIGTWRIRAYGSLNLRDSRGNQGVVKLDRDGLAEVEVRGPDRQIVRLHLQLAWLTRR